MNYYQKYLKYKKKYLELKELIGGTKRPFDSLNTPNPRKSSIYPGTPTLYTGPLSAPYPPTSYTALLSASYSPTYPPTYPGTSYAASTYPGTIYPPPYPGTTYAAPLSAPYPPTYPPPLISKLKIQINPVLKFNPINIEIDGVMINFESLCKSTKRTYKNKDYLSYILNNIVKINFNNSNIYNCYDSSIDEDTYMNRLNDFNGIINIDFENINALLLETITSSNDPYNTFIINLYKLLNNNFMINIIFKNTDRLKKFIKDLCIINATSSNLREIREKINECIKQERLNLYGISLYSNDREIIGKSPIDDAIFHIINIGFMIEILKNKLDLNKLHILTNDNQKIETGKYLFDKTINSFRYNQIKIKIIKYAEIETDISREFKLLPGIQLYSAYQLNEFLNFILINNTEIWDNNIIHIKTLIETLVNSQGFSPNLNNFINNISDNSIIIKKTYVKDNFILDENIFIKKIIEDFLLRITSDDILIEKYFYGIKLISFIKYMQLVYNTIYYNNPTNWSTCNKNINNCNITKNSSECTRNLNVSEINDYFNNLLKPLTSTTVSSSPPTTTVSSITSLPETINLNDEIRELNNYIISYNNNIITNLKSMELKLDILKLILLLEKENKNLKIEIDAVDNNTPVNTETFIDNNRTFLNNADLEEKIFSRKADNKIIWINSKAHNLAINFN